MRNRRFPTPALAGLLALSLAAPPHACDRGSQELAAGNGAASSGRSQALRARGVDAPPTRAALAAGLEEAVVEEKQIGSFKRGTVLFPMSGRMVPVAGRQARLGPFTVWTGWSSTVPVGSKEILVWRGERASPTAVDPEVRPAFLAGSGFETNDRLQAAQLLEGERLKIINDVGIWVLFDKDLRWAEMGRRPEGDLPAVSSQDPIEGRLAGRPDYALGVAGFWEYSGPRRPILGQGYKLHITAGSGETGEVLDVVLPFLREQKVPHKVMRASTAAALSEEKRAQRVKLITVYLPLPPGEYEARTAYHWEDARRWLLSEEAIRHQAELALSLDDLLAEAGLHGQPLPISIERPLPQGRSGRVFWRYGAGVSGVIYGPVSKDDLAVRAYEDHRDYAHALPPWETEATDPFLAALLERARARPTPAAGLEEQTLPPISRREIQWEGELGARSYLAAELLRASRPRSQAGPVWGPLIVFPAQYLGELYFPTNSRVKRALGIVEVTREEMELLTDRVDYSYSRNDPVVEYPISDPMDRLRKVLSPRRIEELQKARFILFKYKLPSSREDKDVDPRVDDPYFPQRPWGALMLLHEALQSDVLMVDFAALPLTDAMRKAWDVYYGNRAKEIYGSPEPLPLIEYPENLTRGEPPEFSLPGALSQRPGFFLFSPNGINHHSLHVVQHVSPFDPPEAEVEGASDLPQRYAQDPTLINRLASVALAQYQQRLSSAAGLEESAEALAEELRRRGGFGFIDPLQVEYPIGADWTGIARIVAAVSDAGLIPKINLPLGGDAFNLRVLEEFRRLRPEDPAGVALYAPEQVEAAVEAAGAEHFAVSAPVGVIARVVEEVDKAGGMGKVLVIAKVRDRAEVEEAERAGARGIEVEPADAAGHPLAETIALLDWIAAAKAGQFLVWGSAGGVNELNARELVFRGCVGFSVGPQSLESKLRWFTAARGSRAGLEEDRITFVGGLATGELLSLILRPSMEVSVLGPGSGLEEVLLSLGLPSAFLQEINASGLEEWLARERAA